MQEICIPHARYAKLAGFVSLCRVFRVTARLFPRPSCRGLLAGTQFELIGFALGRNLYAVVDFVAVKAQAIHKDQ
jgi:hypothetical protein